MRRHEVLEVASEGWRRLSAERGYHVSRDMPVCIFISTLVAEHIPGAVVARIDIPEADDFQAVVVADVEGEPCVVDAAHLVWAKEKPPEEPSLAKATLVLPIRSNLNIRAEIPHAGDLHDVYLDAMEMFVHETAARMRL